MRHLKKGRKFGRISKQRKALYRSLITSLFLYEKITTTEQKAKEIKGTVDRIINWAKKGDFNSIRNIKKIIQHKNIIQKLVNELAKKFENKNSGYCRTYRITNRAGDNSKRFVIQLILPEKIEKTDIVKQNKVETKTKTKENKPKWGFMKKEQVAKQTNKTKVTVAPRTTSK